MKQPQKHVHPEQLLTPMQREGTMKSPNIARSRLQDDPLLLPEISVCRHAAACDTCILKGGYLPGNIGRHGVFVPKFHRLILRRKPKENTMEWAQISSFSVKKAVYTKILILLTVKALILQPV
ncbi:MAG: hypothetical protein NC113_04615 [Bacteroides sp.]|nr:hypothetical protein [Bacteroides sp.]MCM1447490.1 hypothetical protein [Bacteroides sp.]